METETETETATATAKLRDGDGDGDGDGDDAARGVAFASGRTGRPGPRRPVAPDGGRVRSHRTAPRPVAPDVGWARVGQALRFLFRVCFYRAV